MVSNISPLIKNAKNSAELSNFSSLVSAGSSGIFKVHGVEIEVHQSPNMRLGHLIGMGDAPADTGLGEYTVIVGKSIRYNLTGLIQCLILVLRQQRMDAKERPGAVAGS